MQKDRRKHYVISELYGQIATIKNFFPNAISKVKHGKLDITLQLKPTPQSITYTIKLEAKEGKSSVKIHVVQPEIKIIENGKHVPHLYADGSLCLYYPKYHEWDYKKPWIETLIPWASLWLFYYEIWKETGIWNGGGIHGSEDIPPS